MEFLKTKFIVLKFIDDYKTPLLSFDKKQIQPIDQIYLHKQAGEMIYSSLTSSANAASKLQTSLNNINSHLKLERMSSLAKDTRIKALEDIFNKLGIGLSNVDADEEIIKNGNGDIQALRKRLKFSTTKNIQAQEVGDLEKEKEHM